MNVLEAEAYERPAVNMYVLYVTTGINFVHNALVVTLKVDK
jgi:hypothetical protein